MDTLDQLKNRRRTGSEGQLRSIGIHLGSASKEKARSLDPTRLAKAQNQVHPQLGLGLASKEKPRGMGLTGLAKAQNQAHPNWCWDRLAKRNQEAWNLPDRQELKTRRTLIHLGSARKEKVKSMGPPDWQKLKTKRTPTGVGID
ncbi:hypothetical protein L3X38_019560 [Prunus dulcis]|uniref:Uncharacterized protein n=1 Tax=Prunus dulcis TaxID=3755 RepID=A0AAD4WBY5_PRUDU|nr:hypothetical protein L3X38_019560 [Prunus dulcis]